MLSFARAGLLMLCRSSTGKGDANAIRFCGPPVIISSNILYSIHDYAAPEDLGISGYEKAKWAGMWRSIILSSIGVAAYPYSLWIKSLGLSDFQQLLLDIAPDSNLRPHFFKGRMKEFEIVSRTTRTRTGKPVLASQEIIEKVGDTIIKYAKEENKIMQLTSLEASFVPTLLLSIWTSQLPTLTTLTIRDGSVLTEEVAHSIVSHTPACCSVGFS